MLNSSVSTLTHIETHKDFWNILYTNTPEVTSVVEVHIGSLCGPSTFEAFPEQYNRLVER